MRYLAELAWVPPAIRANRQLEWRELDAATVEVATSVGSARVAVRLDFDAAGEIVGSFSSGRPHPEGKTSVPRPWVGVLRLRRHRRPQGSDERRGALDPSRKARSPTGDWRERITSLELLLDVASPANPWPVRMPNRVGAGKIRPVTTAEQALTED
jgi:hypothetical protein